MRIKVLIPNSGMDRKTLNARETMLSRAVSTETEISVDCIQSGPVSIESVTDEVFAGPLLLQEAIRAEREGYDAFVVYCFSDLAITALRENVDIPVIGPGECALAAADILSNKFCVITTVEGNVSRTYRRLMQNPITQKKLSSVRALNIPVAELRDDPDATCVYLKKVCAEAVAEDGIDTVVLGCLGLAQYGEEVEKECGVIPKDMDAAYEWFAAARDNGHAYAEFFMKRMERGEQEPPSVLLSATRLLYHMGNIFRDNAPAPAANGVQIDRKRLAQMRQKRVALGHKPDDHELEQQQGFSMKFHM